MKKFMANVSDLLIKIFTFLSIQIIIIILSLIVGISTIFYIPFKPMKEPIDLLLEDAYELYLYKDGIVEMKKYDNHFSFYDFDYPSQLKMERSIFSLDKLARYKEGDDEHYIGHITEEKIETMYDDETKNTVRKNDNSKNLGYFYSNSRNRIIRFGLTEEEIKQLYGDKIIKKMKKPKKIISRYGDNGVGNRVKQHIIYIRSIIIWALLNLFQFYFIFKRKKLISN